MTKTTTQWYPALGNQITAALPLHNPNNGWIYAKYDNGDNVLVDFTTVLKDAHKIVSISLNDSPATVALHRILLSISYKLLEGNFGSARGWADFRKESMKNNNGFSESKIREYFSEFNERFYLVHENTPFLQDPSLKKYFSDKSSSLGEEDLVKALQKNLSGISNISPLAPSTNSEDGQKTIWGLPEEEIYSTNKNIQERTQILITSLLYQRYTHSATNRGSRAFIDSPNGNDTHHAAHAFRCAIQFIPQGKSLYQTLLIGMEHFDENALKNDLPEWERKINPETGWLELMGYNCECYDVVQSLDSPRSSVNMTHLSLLFFPELDTEKGMMVPDGGQIKQMRRLLFNFKHYKNEKNEKLPFPITWNPYIAIKEDTSKALKQTTGISSLTSMNSTFLSKIPLLDDIKGIVRPSSLKSYSSLPFRAIIPDRERKISIYIFAGDASQDKTFSNFVLNKIDLTELTEELENKDKLEEWFFVGDKLFYNLKKSIKKLIEVGYNEEKVSTLFWYEYTQLFNQQVSSDKINSIIDSKNEVKEIVRETFKETTKQYLTKNPLTYVKELNTLLYNTNKILGENNGK